MNKPRNLTIQCLATLFIPTGIYAFKRINKTRLGIQAYILSFITFVIMCSAPFIYAEIAYGEINKSPESIGIAIVGFVMGGYVLSALIPILFILVHTKRWNNQLEV